MRAKDNMFIMRHIILTIALTMYALYGSALKAVEIQQLSPLHSPRPGDLMEWELRVDNPDWLDGLTEHTLYGLHRRRIDDHCAISSSIAPTAPIRNTAKVNTDRLGKAPLRIRYSPRSAGTLRWQLFAPGTDPQKATPLAADSLKVVQGHKPGAAIQQAPFNKRLLASDEQTPFIPVGPNIAWALGKDRLAQFVTYLDKLAAVGGNHIRVWCSSWFGQIEDQKTATTWRLDQAWLLDQVLAACRERGDLRQPRAR